VNPGTLKKMERLGTLRDLGGGRVGVPVSLQYEARLEEPSRTTRRDVLRRRFEQIEQQLARVGAKVDLGSISVSGQTVDAVLPADSIETIESALRAQHVRVDPLIDRQVV
jgi:hypothetical protein